MQIENRSKVGKHGFQSKKYFGGIRYSLNLQVKLECVEYVMSTTVYSLLRTILCIPISFLYV